MSEEIVVTDSSGLGALSVDDVIGQVTLIQSIMSRVMKKDEHYGKIPGCGPKPTLLKPGAEKLCFTFRLRPLIEASDITLRELQLVGRTFKATLRAVYHPRIEYPRPEPEELAAIAGSRT